MIYQKKNTNLQKSGKKQILQITHHITKKMIFTHF